MNKLKKIAGLLLLCVFVFSAVFVPSPAKAEPGRAIAREYLNFRAKAEKNSPIQSVIPEGAQVLVLEKGAPYSKVVFENKVGFAATDFLALQEELSALRSLTHRRLQPLKEEADRASKTLVSLKPGSIVNLVELLEGWYLVEYQGTLGYVEALGWMDSPVKVPVKKPAPVAPVDGTMDILSDITVYMNAYDAASRVNPAGTYSKGTFTVYKNFGGMVNVTGEPGVPGGWINPADNKEVPAPSPAKPKPEKPLPKGLYELKEATATYMNAEDAANEANALGRFRPGTYHVFHEFGGMLNLSKIQGVPGGWIHPKSTPNAPKTPVLPVQPKEEPKPVKDRILAHANVNLRTGPSLSSEVIRLVRPNEEASLLGREGEWLLVSLGPQKGYTYRTHWTVSEDLLARFPDQNEPVKPDPKPEAPKEGAPTVYLDPGHDGRGTGAISYITGVLADENDLVWDVSTRLKSLLLERGYGVHMSKTHINEDVELADRAADANAKNPDVFVSIHCNAFTSPVARGTIAFAPGYKLSAKTNGWRSDSLRLSRLMASHVGSLFGAYQTVVDTSYGASLAVNRLTQMPSMLLELGFITNPSDAAFLLQPENRQAIAQEMADALDEYFGR
ncbi:hypothetical protein ABB02_00504 [Clostridiaceae bacterium JG1575]|nr:hypothetical protein ABB02_00504 [Clostridiaceae bacterium JG1575]